MTQSGLGCPADGSVEAAVDGSVLLGSALDVAPRLLGWTFRTTVGGAPTAVRLTEVEAYMGTDDPASHAFRGPTERTKPMFGPSGHIYVYLSYGIHFCVNIVTGSEGVGQAVLLRGGEPVEGIDTMVERRGRRDHLTDGPGKVGQALGLTTKHSGLPIDGALIGLREGSHDGDILATPRIGITKAADRPWRFVLEGTGRTHDG